MTFHVMSLTCHVNVMTFHDIDIFQEFRLVELVCGNELRAGVDSGVQENVEYNRICFRLWSSQIRIPFPLIR